MNGKQSRGSRSGHKSGRGQQKHRGSHQNKPNEGRAKARNKAGRGYSPKKGGGAQAVLCAALKDDIDIARSKAQAEEDVHKELLQQIEEQDSELRDLNQALENSFAKTDDTRRRQSEALSAFLPPSAVEAEGPKLPQLPEGCVYNGNDALAEPEPWVPNSSYEDQGSSSSGPEIAPADQVYFGPGRCLVAPSGSGKTTFVRQNTDWLDIDVEMNKRSYWPTTPNWWTDPVVDAQVSEVARNLLDFLINEGFKVASYCFPSDRYDRVTTLIIIDEEQHKMQLGTRSAMDGQPTLADWDRIKQDRQEKVLEAAEHKITVRNTWPRTKLFSYPNPTPNFVHDGETGIKGAPVHFGPEPNPLLFYTKSKAHLDEIKSVGAKMRAHFETQNAWDSLAFPELGNIPSPTRIVLPSVYVPSSDVGFSARFLRRKYAAGVGPQAVVGFLPGIPSDFGTSRPPSGTQTPNIFGTLSNTQISGVHSPLFGALEQLTGKEGAKEEKKESKGKEKPEFLDGLSFSSQSVIKSLLTHKKSYKWYEKHNEWRYKRMATFVGGLACAALAPWVVGTLAGYLAGPVCSGFAARAPSIQAITERLLNPNAGMRVLSLVPDASECGGLALSVFTYPEKYGWVAGTVRSLLEAVRVPAIFVRIFSTTLSFCATVALYSFQEKYTKILHGGKHLIEPSIMHTYKVIKMASGGDIDLQLDNDCRPDSYRVKDMEHTSQRATIRYRRYQQKAWRFSRGGDWGNPSKEHEYDVSFELLAQSLHTEHFSKHSTPEVFCSAVTTRANRVYSVSINRFDATVGHNIVADTTHLAYGLYRAWLDGVRNIPFARAPAQ